MKDQATGKTSSTKPQWLSWQRDKGERMAVLSGKTAIVTGGPRGYGLGIADELKRSGAVVWITGRNEMALQSAAEKLSIHYVRADVASTDGWYTLMGKVMDEC